MDLTRITVYNPDLTTNSDANLEMRKRYSECFSQQVMRRIINFTPEALGIPAGVEKGKFSHFVHDIPYSENHLFF
jgi:hypothetical protein